MDCRTVLPPEREGVDGLENSFTSSERKVSVKISVEVGLLSPVLWIRNFCLVPDPDPAKSERAYK